MKMHKKSLKASKWMQSDESRQGVLTAVNSNLTVVKLTLAVAKVNFATAKNLRINWKL